MPEERTVLIVDDHPGFRSAVRPLLERGGFEVLGEVGTGAAAVTAAAALRPDVVLLDVRLPDISGFEVAAQLHAAANGARVVLISSLPPVVVGARLDPATAVGYIPKDELTVEVLRRLLTAT